MTTDIKALVSEGQAVEERLYKRLGTKSARVLDVDSCVVISKMSNALERQQAVVEAARILYVCADRVVDDGERRALGAPVDMMAAALAALDAPPEKDKRN